MFPNPESINDNFFRARVENRKHLQTFTVLLAVQFCLTSQVHLKMIILRIAELLHTAPYLTLLPKKNKFILSEMSKKFVVFEGIEYQSVRKTCVF